MKRIAIGVVLYNPDSMQRCRQCLERAIHQTDKVYVFDNSTAPVQLEYSEKIVYMSEGTNKGMAYALNQIMRQAATDGYQWVVTMDQDSLLPPGIIEDYTAHISADSNIAILCPQIIDLRRAYMKVKQEPKEEYVEECITSASCIRLEVWRSLGGFDDWLFIDLVDNEFCKRVRVSGYLIKRLNQWVLDQEFGNIRPKSERKQRKWLWLSRVLHNENIAKLSYYKYVNPLRVYYTHRNLLYVNRKLRAYGPVAFQNYNCKGYLGFVLSFTLPSLLRAQKKREVWRAIVTGIRDGMKHTVVPWSPAQKE